MSKSFNETLNDALKAKYPNPSRELEEWRRTSARFQCALCRVDIPPGSRAILCTNPGGVYAYYFCGPCCEKTTGVKLNS